MTLPGGSWIGGARLGEAAVRPITGADQAILAERVGPLPAAERASMILARCVAIDAMPGDALETLRRLSVGDREALLLHVHRLTFGERLRCVLTCANEGCGERMDLEVDASDLIVPPYERSDEWYSLASDDGGAPIRFRLPTGLDQEAVAALAAIDSAAAAKALALRCVAVDDDASAGVDRLDETALGRLADAMLDRDPQAEILLDTTCPACGRAVSALFDAGSFVYEELAAALPRLYREVHTLALRYHWSESEILALTQPQRQRYLDMIAETAGDVS